MMWPEAFAVVGINLAIVLILFIQNRNRRD